MTWTREHVQKGPRCEIGFAIPGVLREHSARAEPCAMLRDDLTCAGVLHS